MKITKRSTYATLAGLGVLVGAGGIAAASSSATTSAPSVAVYQTGTTIVPTPPADTTADHEGSDTPPVYTSSVQTTPEVETAESEAASDASETADDAAIAALATVTPEQASAAALAAQPGTVKQVDVKNEAGNVVYEVEVVDAKGVEFQVIIDAGNAKVLATHADGDPEMPANYTSSIQTEPNAEDKADAAMAALAKVTPEEASAAALAAQPGTVKQVDVKNEAGNVVYEVEVVDAKGVEFQVIIDAGNAKVLATQAD